MRAPGCLGDLKPLEVGNSPGPDEVLFESRGSVLILGDDASVGGMVEAVARHHRTVVFAPGVDEHAFGPRVTAVGRRVTAVRGHLGAFQAEVRSESGFADIGAASPNANRLFDLVLDLGRQPVCHAAVLPLGYLAPGADEDERAQAVQTLRRLVGRWVKPRYFRYQAELCAHGASGLTGCARCLQACDAQAISSAGSTIDVNPSLCQGCASCTLACPSGALSFRPLPRETVWERLRQTLAQHGATATGRTPLVVHAGKLGAEVAQACADHGVATLAVHPLPAFGHELWLQAWAMGVGTLVLVRDEGTPPSAAAVMAGRVQEVRAMLPGWGMPPDRLQWLGHGELLAWLGGVQGDEPRSAATARAGAVDETAARHHTWPKREVLLDAVRQLTQRTDQPVTVALPAGADMGAVRVDARRCTLCLACVHLCPTQALTAETSNPLRLQFRESACLQCGLCVRGCPEKAVSLLARIAPPCLTQAGAAVLHQDDLLACKSCGTPFIGRRLLAVSLERIQGHPVLAQGGKDAFLICPSCRQQRMLQL